MSEMGVCSGDSLCQKVFLVNVGFNSHTQRVFCAVLNGKLQLAGELLSRTSLSQSGVTSDNIAEFFAVQSLASYALGNYKTALRFAIRSFEQGTQEMNTVY